MDQFKTKDSGERREFTTGSRRDVREGKGRYDLLPHHGIRRLAGLYERGAGKYGDRNWEKGQPLASYADSMLRHAFQATAGYTDEDHWAAVAWNALAVIDHLERIALGELPAALDDLPKPPTLPSRERILAVLDEAPQGPQGPRWDANGQLAGQTDLLEEIRNRNGGQRIDHHLRGVTYDGRPYHAGPGERQ